MVEDLNERVQRSQNKVEALMDKIPGIGGYQRKEKRRDADKLLRDHVARQLEEQLSRLANVQRTLTEAGDLSATLKLERAVTKLQVLIDRIKTASYGYAGLFDAVKVDEDVLDRLYQFDEAMLENLDELASRIAQLETAALSGGDTAVSTNELILLLEKLNNTYSQRQDVILA